MKKKLILGSLFFGIFLSGMALTLNYIEKNTSPPKGYKISVNGVIYNVDYYFIDGEYLKFTDDYNRPIEIHKNFATVSEVK